MNAINIVDSPMGSGKTNTIIGFMKAYADRKYLFVTPFLNEIDRIMKNCSSLDFVTPPKESISKSEYFKKQIKENKNIAVTHKLFSIIKADTIDLLRGRNYTLIMDEVIEVINHINCTERDIQILNNESLISVSDNGLVEWLDMSYERKGNFAYIKQVALAQKLFCYNGALIWLFPVCVFNCFSEVFILTYLFEGSR